MTKTLTPTQVAALTWAAKREGKGQSAGDYHDALLADLGRQQAEERVSKAVAKIKSADETEKTRLLSLIENE